MKGELMGLPLQNKTTKDDKTIEIIFLKDESQTPISIASEGQSQNEPY